MLLSRWPESLSNFREAIQKYSFSLSSVVTADADNGFRERREREARMTSREIVEDETEEIYHTADR